jgi:hypothetical protein
MKNNKYGESRNLSTSSLNSKSADELIEELNARIAEDDFDEALVEDYLAVLRDKTSVTMEDFDVQESFRRFKEKYAVEYEAAISSPPKRRIPKRLLRNAGIIAAAFCLVLLMLTVRQDAYGNSFFKKIVHWGEETLSIRSLPPGGQMSLPIGSESEYRSIAEALEQNGIPSNNCPTWIPEGFALDKIEVAENEVTKVFLAIYKNDEITIQFAVLYGTGQLGELIEEKDPGGSTYYGAHGREYYIMTNMGKPKAAWYEGNNIYHISGNIPMEDLYMMIDSIK